MKYCKNIKLSKRVHNKLRKISVIREKTMSDIVDEVLTEYVNNQKGSIEI